MKEDSAALEMMNRYGAATGVRCWGANFDISGPGSGFAIEIEGLLRGAMYDVENDLVVPTSSTLAFGSPAPRLYCSHLQYFSQPAVAAALQTWFAQKSASVAGVDATALRADLRFKPLRLKFKPRP